MVNASLENRKKLGQQIQRIRKSLNHSQEDLAYTIGISRTHMGHIEQGRKSPSLEVLQAIAKVFKMKVSDLIPF